MRRRVASTAAGIRGWGLIACAHWGFRKDDEGNLRIVLHHSSLPYAE
jgi:hypothetical protein